MTRYITLADGRKMTLGNYAQAWREVLAAPPNAVFDRCLHNRWAAGRDKILDQFRVGLHARINSHLPWYGKGRKWDDDYQRPMVMAAAQLNCRRAVIDWLPPDLRRRFDHRLRVNRV